VILPESRRRYQHALKQRTVAMLSLWTMLHCCFCMFVFPIVHAINHVIMSYSHEEARCDKLEAGSDDISCSSEHRSSRSVDSHKYHSPQNFSQSRDNSNANLYWVCILMLFATMINSSQQQNHCLYLVRRVPQQIAWMLQQEEQQMQKSTPKWSLWIKCMGVMHITQ
jgi:hypothetical protein